MKSMGRFAALAALLGSAAAPAAASGAAEGTDPFAALELDEATRASLTTELQAFVEEQKAEAFKAANDRAVKVMGSDKGKANPVLALALLGNEKLSALSADEILAAIPEAPPAAAGTGDGKTQAELDAEAAAAAAAAGGAGGSNAHEKRLAAAPKIALGNRASTGPEVEETDPSGGGNKAAALDLWGNVQKVTEGGTRGANGARVRVGAAAS